MKIGYYIFHPLTISFYGVGQLCAGINPILVTISVSLAIIYTSLQIKNRKK